MWTPERFTIALTLVGFIPLVEWRTAGLIIQLIHHRQFPLPSVCTFSALAGLGDPSYKPRELCGAGGETRTHEGFLRRLTKPLQSPLCDTSKFGGPDRTRTRHPLRAKQMLSQMSYWPRNLFVMASRWGIRRSIQLSTTAHPPFAFLTCHINQQRADGCLVGRVGLEPTANRL